MLFFETSALSGYNIENAFYTATSMILDKIKKAELQVEEVFWTNFRAMGLKWEVGKILKINYLQKSVVSLYINIT
jgi:hypothetical protein